MKKRIISILLTLVILIGMMPLSAFAAGITVSYLDADGNLKTANNVTEITSGGTYGAGYYGEGWYILKGTKTLEKITFTDKNTHLILADGADITVLGGILVDSDDLAKKR